MRQQLLGYLMAALEPHEAALVEAQLETDPELSRQCQLLKRSLEPLECDRELCEPPPQLAARTCQWVAERSSVRLAPETVGSSRRWSAQDFFVTAGTMAAAAMLFFPAVNYSREQAATALCQDRLRQIGLAYMNYSERFNPYFPAIPETGPLAAAGAYAPMLTDAKLIGDQATFLCPGDRSIDPAEFHVPSTSEVESADGQQLSQLQRIMGGSYGATFGHLNDENNYVHTKDMGRACFALVTDRPSDGPGHQSLNHGGRGQNTLFEDGHVKFLKSCRCPIETGGDDIFENDQGTLGPGLHAGDAVIGNGPYVSSTEMLSVGQ